MNISVAMSGHVNIISLLDGTEHYLLSLTEMFSNRHDASPTVMSLLHSFSNVKYINSWQIFDNVVSSCYDITESNRDFVSNLLKQLTVVFY